MRAGLKGFWKESKGERLRIRLKQLKWELKYAWKRAWYGYDDTDIFSMDYRFIERYSEILKEYRKTHHCLFSVPLNQNKENIYHTEEETDKILDEMIYHLQMMNEDYAEKELYGSNIYDSDYKIKSLEEMKHLYSTMDKHKEEFMKLFNDYFWQLWD